MSNKEKAIKTAELWGEVIETIQNWMCYNTQPSFEASKILALYSAVGITKIALESIDKAVEKAGIEKNVFIDKMYL